jgi:hypothetical protein
MSNCAAASVAWGVDKGNVGTIPAGPSTSAVFTPSGTTGGLVTITASLNKQTVTRQVLVKLTATQNGPNGSPGETAQIHQNPGQLTAGGGVGGVGGEGLGTATDQGTITALGAPTGNGSAQGLQLIYPYDKTSTTATTSTTTTSPRSFPSPKAATPGSSSPAGACTGPWPPSRLTAAIRAGST